MNNEILRFVHIYLEPVLKIAKSLFKKVKYILETIMGISQEGRHRTLTPAFHQFKSDIPNQALMC